MAGVSISGGETAQLKDIVKGFDLVGMAIGCVDLDKVICGRDVRPGDIVIGVRSSGIHSNGLSLARRAFFESQNFRIDHKFDELATTLGELERRLGELGLAYEDTKHDDVAAALFDAERTVRAAARSVERARQALR